MRNQRVFLRVTPLTRLSAPLLSSIWEMTPGAPPLRIVNTFPADAGREDIVLYSFLTTELPDLDLEISTLRQKGVTLAAGGHHAMAAADFARALGFHTVACGDGETALTRMATDLAAGIPLKAEYPGDPGQDFSQWLPVSRSIPTLPPLEIMRGCRHNCAFCAVHGSGRPRFRGLESIRCYLDHLRRGHATRINFICPSALEYRDPESGADCRQSVANLLDAARCNGFRHIEYGIFPSEIRPESLNPEWVHLLGEYVSNRRVTIGAQSGCAKRLLSLGRGHLPSDVENAVESANAGGFTVNLDFIIGLPDETEPELGATLDFIQRLHQKYRIHAQVHHFFPLPGTALHERLPAYPGTESEKRLGQMHQNGLITAQWRSGRDDIRRYLSWLSRRFPEQYARFH
ncbi:MAG: radical SAM protein [Acidobacteriota bacterium]|jgi:radical SAM superfamily enzyme YgiQ (UPF0313 family)|nr:radical SAM protein [Acidobacteriota bacterium]